jgi:DNA-binding beta-propeller fold protein YncE
VRVAIFALIAACRGSAPPAAVITIALPGGGSNGVGMDGLAYDPHTRTVWVPAGNTGSVDVVDTATSRVTQLGGFATRQVERDGRTRVVGPSAAAVGDGVVYIASRGDSSVCAISDATLAKGACTTLDASPDGIAYVGATHEVWVTTPRDRSIRILDGATLAQKSRIELADGPEGVAVDAPRGRFYTNVGGATIAIDLASHATVATWQPGCAPEEPHGLAVDPNAALVFVACSSKIVVLDPAHDGATRGSVPTGDGLDDFDYDPATRTLYAGAARAATLTVATVDGSGAPHATATIPTAAGARNGVVNDAGRVYLAHSAGSELIVVPTR